MRRRLAPRVVPRSGLPAARTAVRRTAGINRPNRRRRPVQRDDDTSPNAPNPYNDPSRDLGEGPDGLSRTQTVVLWVGIMFAIYLASASCGTADLPPVPEHRCHICNEIGYDTGGNP